jgi:GNAT superfamily N-acetyltransferase
VSDMLVKLYELPEPPAGLEALGAQGISILRALPPDRYKVIAYVKSAFGDGWAGECESAFGRQPVSCFLAVRDRKIVGFACYDCTAKGFFGPTGVDEALRGRGVGRALLLRSLLALREEGYGYAIIGAAGRSAPFYQKAVGAIPIEGSFPGIYARLVDRSG